MHNKKFHQALTLLAAALIGTVTPAHAHRSWLLPSSTQIDSKEAWVTIDAAVSENLFELDSSAPRLDGLTITGPDGMSVKPENIFSGHLRSSFDLKLPQPGTYRISMANESAMASYKLNGEPKRWRGAAADMKKDIPIDATELRVTALHNRLETFVSAGKPNFPAWQASNSGLELIPLTHPNELAIGQAAQFRLLLDGQAAANLPLSVIPGGVRYRGILKEMRITTNAQGEFSVVWPEAGMYYISATYPPRPTAAAGMPPAPEARRVSYAATLEVLP